MRQSLDLIIPPRLRARHWEGWAQVMASGQSRYGVGDLLAVPALRHDGTSISVEFTISPLADGQGELVGIAATLRDVSVRFEETRELRRKLGAALMPAPAASGGDASQASTAKAPNR